MHNILNVQGNHESKHPSMNVFTTSKACAPLHINFDYNELAIGLALLPNKYSSGWEIVAICSTIPIVVSVIQMCTDLFLEMCTRLLH